MLLCQVSGALQTFRSSLRDVRFLARSSLSRLLHALKMSRVAFVAGAALLLGASCFVLPGSTPSSAPEVQVSTGRSAGAAAPEAESTTAAFSPLALGAALGLLAAVVGSRPALAADLENGEAIFNGNCTACHAGGNNSIVAEKKLKLGCMLQFPVGIPAIPT